MKKKILFIDDNYHIRSMINDFMPETGVDFTVLDNAHEALELLKHDHYTHMVIDLALGSSKGEDFIRQVKFKMCLPLKIAIFTGNKNVKEYFRTDDDLKYIFKPDWESVEKFIGFEKCKVIPLLKAV